MASTFAFEDPGEGIHEAEVLEVLVERGDRVETGQNVVVVETDKASFELSSPRDGIVADVVVSEGDQVEVGDPLLHYQEGDDAQAAGSDEGAEPESKSRESSKAEADDERKQPEAKADDERKQPEAKADDERKQAKAEADDGRKQAKADAQERESTPSQSEAKDASRSNGHDHRPPVRATPATRKLARDLDVDLHEVEPSGSEGRIMNEDVRAAGEARNERDTGDAERSADQDRTRAKSRESGKPDRGATRDQDDFGPTERVPLRSVRRRTAQRMAQSWREVARVTHHDEADVTELERLRQRLQSSLDAEELDLSLTVMVMKTLAAVLQEYPRFNASLGDDGESVVLKHYVHLGIAADTEQGLLVPVIRDVPAKSLRVLARELGEVTRTAREGKLRRAQMQGGTFTLTNVGPIGGTGFTPIVNPPQTAILGLGRAELKSRVRGDLDNHHTEVRMMLPLSLSFDHRVIDGAEAARFVRRLCQLLGDADGFIAGV